MARRLHCFVTAREENKVTDQEWEKIRKLQHWYSSEFFWTAGKPALKMYAVFPNLDHPLADENGLMEFISKRWNELRREGITENQILRMMRNEKLIILKEGGYRDGCLLSGSVRVANNEWNAYLFVELVLKASTIAENATFEVHDEGDFIRWRPVYIRRGNVTVVARSQQQYGRVQQIIDNNELFAPVDSHEYDNHPYYRTQVSGFRKMQHEAQRDTLKNWNWHGYESILHSTENRASVYALQTKVKEISISTL
jgi:hypothetical protein